MRTKISLNIIGLVAVAYLLVGCTEIIESRKRQTIIERLIKERAPESELRTQIPIEWISHDKETEEGRSFGKFVENHPSRDMLRAKQLWRESDRVLYHTTESVVTLVFIKGNTLIGYYVASQ